MSESEFQETLDRYKKNLTQYKATGNVGSKIASETDKKWLDAYIANLKSTIEKNETEMNDFVKSYANSDEELAELKKEMATIRKEGPELQVLYETEREAQKKEPIDYTVYYTKGAVLAGVTGLILVASMF